MIRPNSGMIISLLIEAVTRKRENRFMKPLVAPSSASDDILIFGTPEELLPVLDGILQSTSYRYSFIHSQEDITSFVTKHKPLLVMISCLQGNKGFDACASIKTDPATAFIPVIGLGMHQKRPSMTEVLECGFDDFFVLPEDAPAFYVRTGTYISLRNRIRDLEKHQEHSNEFSKAAGHPEDLLPHGDTKLDSFLKNANDNVFLLSTMGKLLYVSPNWHRVLGYSPGEHVGKQIIDTLVHPDDKEICLQALLKGLETRKPISRVEYRMKHLDGSWRWQSTNIAPLIDANGDFNSFMGISHDITEKKSAETALYNSEKGYFGLFNSVTEGIFILDENGYFLDVNRSVEKMFGYNREEIIGKTPDFIYANTENGSPLIMSCIREVFKTGEPKHFVVWGRRKNGEVFPKEVICNKGKYFGKDVVITTTRDVTERIKSETALKESQEKFSKIFHLSPDAIILTRVADGVIVDVNDRGASLSGFPREEIIGKTTLDLDGWEDDEDRNKYVSLLRKNGRVVNYEKTFKTKGGFVRNATISGEFLEVAGEKYILTVIHDITDRKEFEEKLKEEVIKQKLISDNLPDTVVFQAYRDLAGNMFFPYISNGIEKITGITAEEAMKDSSIIYGLIHDEDLPKLFYEQNQSYENMSSFDFECRLKKTGEEEQWVHIRSFPRKTDKGIVIWDGLLSDITERKNAARKVMESEEKYRMVVENALDVIYVLDANLQVSNINSAITEVLGYLPEELIGHSAYIFISDDETEYSRSMLDKRMGGVEKTRYELRLKAKDGRLVPFEVQTRSIYKKGVFDGVLGIARDITERKKSEAALDKTLHELKDYKYALDQAANVSLADNDGTVLYVNDGFCKIYGYTPEEIIGKNHKVLNSSYHSPEFWESFWKTIQSGKVLKGEVRNKGKDGSLTWSDTTIVPFLDAAGKPYQYLAIRRDITEKRKLEEELAAQQLHNQRLITEITIQEQEMERNTISNELHENISQILASAKIFLGIAKTRYEKEDDMLSQSYEYLNKAMDLIKELSYSLITPSLTDFGLAEALKDLVEENRKKTGVQFKFINKTGDDLTLDNKQILMLYRIVQEQLNNITRHANAKQASITLEKRSNTLYLEIKDDGKGFNPETEPMGFGLTNIRNRVEFYQGKLNIISAPKQGCTVLIEIPLTSPEEIS